MRREVRSSSVGDTCLTKSSSAPCGAHTRSSALATPRAIDARIIASNSAAISSGAGMRSTVPSSAEAMPRTSSTRHWSPTPRQSHWKAPMQDWTAACSEAGVSPSLTPSVSRIACRFVTCGTVSKIWRARVSQVPIAVPPLGAQALDGAVASPRVCDDIGTRAPWWL